MIGLDIGSHSVRVVELGQDGAGSWVLERYMSEPLPNGAVSAEGRVENFEQVVDTVRRAVKRSGTKAKLVAAALPASDIIAKRVVLPEGLREDEMDQQIESEASQLIPFPLEEMSVDYYVLGPSMQSAGDVDVVIAAARQEHVDEMVAVVEAAGLKLHVLGVNAYAAQLAAERLIEALPKKGAGAVIALVQVGARTTTIHVLLNGVVIFEHVQAIGGIHLTELVAKHYGMTQDEAEAKKVGSQLPDEYAHVVLEPYMNRLAQEIQSGLQFFYNSTPYGKVDYVLLAGGGAVMPRLNSIISDATGAPCLLLNPFDHMDMGGAVQDRRLKRDASGFLTACGLAMRRFMS